MNSFSCFPDDPSRIWNEELVARTVLQHIGNTNPDVVRFIFFFILQNLLYCYPKSEDFMINIKIFFLHYRAHVVVHELS